MRKALTTAQLPLLYPLRHQHCSRWINETDMLVTTGTFSNKRRGRLTALDAYFAFSPPTACLEHAILEPQSCATLPSLHQPRAAALSAHGFPLHLLGDRKREWKCLRSYRFISLCRSCLTIYPSWCTAVASTSPGRTSEPLRSLRQANAICIATRTTAVT
jgi:hypothetical protein